MRPTWLVFTLSLFVSLATPGLAQVANQSAQSSGTLAAPVVSKALELADKGSLKAAQALVAPFKSPLLDGLLIWRAALADSPEVGFWEIAVFLDRHPGWPQESNVVVAAEKRFPEEIDPATLSIWFESYRPRSMPGIERALAHYSRIGQEAEVSKLARKAWREQSMSEDVEKRFLAAYSRFLTNDDDRERFEALLSRQDSKGALRQAARLGTGIAALARARLKLAGDEPGVDGAVRAVPANLQDDEGLLYERAHWRLRRNRYEGVMEILDPPHPEYRDADRWWRLRHWAAREAMDRKDFKAAYRIAAGNGLESGIEFAQAEWLAGWLALRFLDRPGDALAHFQRLYDGVGTPISKGRAAYWAGRAVEATAGMSSETRRWYELAAAESTSFYGQLAAVRAGLHQRNALSPAQAVPPADTKEKEAFEAKELVQVVRLLNRFDETERLSSFVIALRSNAESASDYRLLADLAAESKRTDLAVIVAKSAQLADVYLEDYLYPLPPVAPFPAQQLQQRNPEAALVLALIRQESLFRRDAISRVGARGLMQLMPGTAKKVAKDLGLPYSSDRLLDDGGYNMTLGSAYLKEMLERFGGSHILAIAAYNAGPGRVDEWLGRFGNPTTPGVDPVDWIERIPFYETRNYVQRVLEAMVVYRQRIGGPNALELQLSQDLDRAAGR
ncbi:lytic transglycosylase domain-containing protein [Limibacillus sp. MBR-115]|jgi:soluble lytic murein transglycosylase|uniref:lytic transglycosylase domain-containing protein n=1 Tax=Limibacillus sp. MBR-115 TaxID=3156465 RepID=UPI0033967645